MAMSIVFIAVAVIWVRFFDYRGWRLWYDTPVEFLFFATAAIISIAKPRAMRTGDRVFLLPLVCCCWGLPPGSASAVRR